MYILALVYMLLNADLACAAATNIIVHPNKIINQVNPLLLGTNAVMWITPDKYKNATLINRTKYSGVKLIRIPGGSNSDKYGWLSCERRADQPGAYQCVEKNWETWASRPTDFINFLRATGKEAMFTVNVNATRQEAAAAVAFFNAKPDNQTVIGIDRNGFDWKTAGYWAQLRADHGNPEPFRIKYWEIGNEVYRACEAGADKENAWTCDGTEYMNGKDQYDGYIKMRDTMRTIDPSIYVGAVGYEYPGAFNNWGYKVIEVLKSEGNPNDFYIIHPYAYCDDLKKPPPPPPTWTDMLAQPRNLLPKRKEDLRVAFGQEIHIAATEYNLICSPEQDEKNRLMERMGNALFVAETIGQMISNGYWAANQWYLANATNSNTGNRDSYGLIQVDSGFNRTPQYYVFPLWARFGNTMLAMDVNGSNDPTTQLSVYAGKIDTNTYSLLVINKTNNPLAASIAFDDGTVVTSVLVDRLQSDNQTLDSQNPIFNGVSNPSDDLSNAPSLQISPASLNNYSFQPYSITLLRMGVNHSPVYRFFNNNAGGHFFTISEDEKNTVINNYQWFRYEGVGFYAFPTPTAGAWPVYRFFNNNAGGHFFTISEDEKNTVINNYKWFRYEGVGFYASPTPAAGVWPVYRFFNNNAGGHFFTISEDEKNTVINNYKWFRYEGVGFYAFPTAN